MNLQLEQVELNEIHQLRPWQESRRLFAGEGIWCRAIRSAQDSKIYAYHLTKLGVSARGRVAILEAFAMLRQLSPEPAISL